MPVSVCRQEWTRTAAPEPWTVPPGLRLAPRFDEPPQEPGFLAEPALDRWPEAARRNRRLLQHPGLQVAGLPLVQIRRCLREEFPQLPIPLASGDTLTLVSGHQPILYHPGVWVKLFAGARAAAAGGGRLLNLVVDSDVSDLAVPLPARHPEQGWEPVRLEVEGTGSGEWPLERRPAPAPEAWRRFVARVRSHLEPLAPQVAARLERLAAVQPRTDETAAAFATRVRRAWEAEAPVPGPRGYPEAFISTLSESFAFRLWVVEWAATAPSWRAAYNEALRQYRVIHRLRYPANPFPDLEEGPEGVEIPFWSLALEGDRWVRRPVVVQGAGLSGWEPTGVGRLRSGSKRILLRTVGPQGTRTLAELPAGDPLEAAQALAEAGLSLRPKAIPLSLFGRLFLGDLFIHGTGGARYESIGDFLLAARWPQVFGQQALLYAACSATLHLDVPEAREQAAEKARLEELARSLEHNPQRLVAELAGSLGDEAARAGIERDPELVKLAARKEQLVEQIQSGGDRKALGKAIREVNGELARRLRPLAGYLQDRLEAARQAEAVLTERGYPFFLFEPEELWRLVADPGSPPGPPGRG